MTIMVLKHAESRVAAIFIVLLFGLLSMVACQRDTSRIIVITIPNSYRGLIVIRETKPKGKSPSPEMGTDIAIDGRGIGTVPSLEIFYEWHQILPRYENGITLPV